MKKQISVIIVNYNGKKYNDACIASILNSTIKEQLRIVVVDNFSTDDSLEALRGNGERTSRCIFLPSMITMGFLRRIMKESAIRWNRGLITISF